MKYIAWRFTYLVKLFFLLIYFWALKVTTL